MTTQTATETLTAEQITAIVTEAKADGERHADECLSEDGADANKLAASDWGNAAVEASRYADSLDGLSDSEDARRVYTDAYEDAARAACKVAAKVAASPYSGLDIDEASQYAASHSWHDICSQESPMNTTTKSLLFYGPQGVTASEFRVTDKYLPTNGEGRVVRLWVSQKGEVAGEWGTKFPGSDFQADPTSEFDNGLRYLGCQVGGQFFEGEWPNEEESKEVPGWAAALVYEARALLPALRGVAGGGAPHAGAVAQGFGARERGHA